MTLHKNILAARVAAVNNANAEANRLKPVLMEAVKPMLGQKATLNGGDLSAKFKAAIEPLLPPYSNALHVYKYNSNYSLVYVVKTCESINGNGCTYHESSVYVCELEGHNASKLYDGDKSVLKTDWTEADIQQRRETYKVAKKIADAAQAALHPFGEFDR